MDSNRTLPVQEPNRVRHAVLGRKAQEQVRMVGHRVTFHQPDPSLTTQLAQNRAAPGHRKQVLIPCRGLADSAATGYVLELHVEIVQRMMCRIGQLLQPAI
jgi:hypothetical protein